MATYSSYKKVDGSSLSPGSIPTSAVDPDARKTFGVKWVYGSPNACSQGCCCLWSVPAGVTKVFLRSGVLVDLDLVHVLLADAITMLVVEVEDITPR